MKWKKLGRILKPEAGVSWLATFTGPSFALTDEKNDQLMIYVTGRDNKNRSRIGRVEFDMKAMSVTKIHDDPVIELGEKGSFDQNGTGYPWLVESDGKLYMYYVGWIPSVLVPFHNDIGLGVSSDGGANFTRVSRAPLLPASAAEYLGTGSLCVIKEDALWKMWYTCFHRWGEEGEEKHYYNIKYATSSDGVHWQRPDKVCIPFADASEYAIGKPAVVKHGGKYHMWYVYRGQRYKMGYAESADGINWRRLDDKSGLVWSETGWDSEMVCYPHCFDFKGKLYMLYNGNDYGKSGLGLAELESWN